LWIQALPFQRVGYFILQKEVIMIKIGTCGYERYSPEDERKRRYKSKLRAYSSLYDVCEINSTFYNLPKVKTAERWRGEVLPNFEFTLKAWQAITHPVSSPTWKRWRGELTDEQRRNFGSLRPNEDNIEAWERTKEIAKAVKAKICVIQTPKRFGCNQENEQNMRIFFEKIDHKGLEIAWEPRGDWKREKKKVKEICDDLGLIHVVDLMRYEPVSEHPITYVRLHGLNPREYDYNYNYTEEELKQLSERIIKLEETGKEVYCLFNNYEMYSNARSLKEIIKGELAKQKRSL
jgi:uncharacterized protein YecE (DUF72 family)